MKKMIPWLSLLLLLGSFPLGAESTWRGQAGVSSNAGLPENGLYAATNEFPRGTILEVRNLRNNKSLRIQVLKRSVSALDLNFIYLSSQAGRELEIRTGESVLVSVSVLENATAISGSPETSASLLTAAEGSLKPLTTLTLESRSGEPVTSTAQEPKSTQGLEYPALVTNSTSPGELPLEKPITVQVPPGTETLVAVPDLPVLANMSPVPGETAVPLVAPFFDGALSSPETKFPSLAALPLDHPGFVLIDAPLASPVTASAGNPDQSLALEIPALASNSEAAVSIPTETAVVSNLVPEIGTTLETVISQPPLALETPVVLDVPAVAENPAVTEVISAGTIPPETPVSGVPFDRSGLVTLPKVGVAAVSQRSSRGDEYVTQPLGVTTDPLGDVKLITKLGTEGDYIQLGAFRSQDQLFRTLEKINSFEPLAVWVPEGETPSYRLMAGPLRRDQLGILFKHYQDQGFRDAVIIKRG